MLAVLHLPKKCTGLRDVPLNLFTTRSLPFGYPKRVFNSFPLRDLSDLMVIDDVGEAERAYSCLQISLEI